MGGQVETLRPALGATGNSGCRWAKSLNPYCTSYSAFYDKESFSTAFRQYSGTGYSANLRPAVYYRPSLDHIDNPSLGLSLLDSFQSQTKCHLQPIIRSDFSQSLPRISGKNRESGYLQLTSLPRATAFLNTESESFALHPPQPAVLPVQHIVGAKEKSGFTEEVPLQPNTFLPSYMSHPRRTEISVTKTDFLPISFLQGSEPLPGLASRAPRETGFSHDTLDGFACPASPFPSFPTRNTIKGLPMEMSIGKKEGSGFILNAPNLSALPNTPYHCSHFLTSYQSKFCDSAAFEKLKPKWNKGGIHKAKSHGYASRDTDRFNLKE